MAPGPLSRSGEEGRPGAREEAAPRARRRADEGQPRLSRPSGDLPIASIAAIAPAKINLFLHVVGRRADGYHELDSLIVFADIGDRVRVEEAGTLTLEVEGPFAEDLGSGADNLVLRAADALAREVVPGKGAAITLTKNLPVASGLGGGSADAAATLRALCRLWGMNPEGDRLAALGLALGADVPVCLFGRPARVQGIGERIRPVADLPTAAMLLVNPGVAVSTALVFEGRAGPYSRPAELPPAMADAAALARCLAACRNDLADPARRLAPAIDAVLAALAAEPGCLIARLSGSGATCFGLFDAPEAAHAAAARLQRRHAGWWVKAGRLLTETPPPQPAG